MEGIVGSVVGSERGKGWCLVVVVVAIWEGVGRSVDERLVS